MNVENFGFWVNEYCHGFKNIAMASKNSQKLITCNIKYDVHSLSSACLFFLFFPYKIIVIRNLTMYMYITYVSTRIMLLMNAAVLTKF
jgi:hypothetical protein